MSFKHLVIPVRAGSKGLPRKNIKLFDYTASKIPTTLRDRVIVSTDDNQIEALSEAYGFTIYHRDPSISDDTTDIRTTLKTTLANRALKRSDVIIMLYLTYPEREFEDVERMYNEFITSDTRSMLCRQPVLTHPCLTMIVPPSGAPEPVIDHKFYQRQQYPECFELSHYICMFRYGELKKLNRNMYNSDTKYYSIDRVVDVDNPIDYDQLSNI